MILSKKKKTKVYDVSDYVSFPPFCGVCSMKRPSACVEFLIVILRHGF